MNKERRAEIAKAAEMIREAVGILENARDGEQEYLDNMPENMQGGDKGSAAEEAISNLDSAISDAESAADNAESVE